MANLLKNQRGQSTVELALCLPALALLLAFAVEVALVIGDHVRLSHAAREAVRVAVVDPDASAVRAAASRSGLENLEIKITPDSGFRVQGEPLEVRLSASSGGHVPLVGKLFESIELHASAAMRIEEP
jgi:TadE-like protein